MTNPRKKKEIKETPGEDTRGSIRVVCVTQQYKRNVQKKRNNILNTKQNTNTKLWLLCALLKQERKKKTKTQTDTILPSQLSNKLLGNDSVS